MRTFVWACVLVIAAPAAVRPAAEDVVPASRDDAVASPADIDRLIRDLGAERYDLRQKAEEDLRRIGLPALAPLEKASTSEDPEIRTRAEKILKDLRLGITPDWPAELALLARHYQGLADANQRSQTMHRISEQLKEKGVPFLVVQMAGEDREARQAFDLLREMGSDAAWQKVLEVLREPKGPWQTRALALAHIHAGRPLVGLKLLGEGPDAIGSDDIRREVAEGGVNQLLKEFEERDFRKTAQDAEDLAKALPDEARFLYLLARALTALDEDDRARALNEQAFALHPTEAVKHFTAGEMLMRRLRCFKLAAREFEAVLAIAPDEDIYDVNACFRLSAIYEESGLFQKASDFLAKGLEIYNRKKEGGMFGASPDDLAVEVENLRRKAKRIPAPPDARCRDPVAEEGVHLDIRIDIKDKKLAEMNREVAKAVLSFDLNVAPEGLRIFDAAPAMLRYDPDKKEIGVTLNDSPCGKPMPYEAKTDKFRVAVNQLDCCYIFEVDAATGKAEKVARFEKDYTVKLVPGIKLAALTDVTVKINDKPYDWSQLLKGMDFDWMPKALKIAVEGTSPRGRHVAVNVEVKVKEPKALSAPSPAAPDRNAP